MRKLTLVSLLLLVALVSQAQAATIHMRFFESTDVTLDDERLQVFSVSMLQGEFLTVVAYGMEEGVLPALTLIDPNGSTVAEDLNPSQRPVAYVQENVPANGMYTFIVSRQGEVGGLIRVMVFEGEALAEGTLIDTLDPFAPSRAFMLATDPQEPIPVSIDLVEPEDETVIVPQVFGSRATAAELPPTTERTTPLPEGFYVWENGAQTPFYTINVRPFPEVLATSLKQNAYFAPVAQAFEIFDYILCVGECGEPERLIRRICTVDGLEVVGISENGQFYQVVDPNSNSGFRLVPASTLNVDVSSPDCTRVQPVQVTLPTVSGGGGGGGLFDLPPGSDPAPAEPGEGDSSVDLFDPTAPPPPDLPFTNPVITPSVTAVPANITIDLECVIVCTMPGPLGCYNQDPFVQVIYTGVPAGGATLDLQDMGGGTYGPFALSPGSNSFNAASFDPSNAQTQTWTYQVSGPTSVNGSDDVTVYDGNDCQAWW